jgi:hypothetical protein
MMANSGTGSARVDRQLAGDAAYVMKQYFFSLVASCIIMPYEC